MNEAPKSQYVGVPPSSRKSPPLDPRLLHVVQRTFQKYAGKDQLIDVKDLQKSLNIHSEFLARHILLTVFDRDGNGKVSQAEFMEAVRRLVFGTTRQKLRLAFQLHDLDGNGRIELSEIKRMIALNLGEEAGSDVSGVRSTRMRDSKVDELSQLFVLTADQNSDGALSWEEFERIASSDPRLLALLSESEATRLVPDGQLLPKRIVKAPLSTRLSQYLENRRSWLLFVTFWAFLNAGLFAWGALSYASTGKRLVMLAHGAGATLDLNAALVLFPVMRRLMTSLRSTEVGRLLPLDDALSFHRLLGHSLVLGGLLHSVAHFANYSVNMRGIAYEVSKSAAAITGVVLLFTSLVMWVLSLPPIRKGGRFELFYFGHFGYMVWFGLALFHAKHLRWAVALPALLFIGEWLVRQKRRAKVAPVLELAGLGSGVSRITVERPEGFQHRAGDFAFLKIPELAKHEWHPFTISSAPEHPHLTFHVRSSGDWTKSLRKLCDARQASGSNAALPLHIDGPYGAPSAHITSTRHAVMIGAGIGVTPFASVLDSIVERANAGGTELEKLYFFWLSRESRAFEWFAELLLELEQRDKRGLVDIHICMTGGRGNVAALVLNLARELSHDIGKPDLVTGLRTQTRLSAPDFESELRQIAERHAPHPVEVFYCGPPALGRNLSRICGRLGLKFREEGF